MDSVLSGLKWQTCIVYLDDVLIFLDDFDSHLLALEAVFQHLHNHKLKLKPSKCNFAQQELCYLGYLINPDGIGLDSAKVTAVTSLKVP